MDIWVAIAPDNAFKRVSVLRQFSMDDPKLTPALFQERGKIIRMGVPPMRIEILTEIDGVAFADCYAGRITTEIDGQSVHLISLEDLRMNKRAPVRHKDPDDLEHLPEDSPANNTSYTLRRHRTESEVRRSIRRIRTS